MSLIPPNSQKCYWAHDLSIPDSILPVFSWRLVNTAINLNTRALIQALRNLTWNSFTASFHTVWVECHFNETHQMRCLFCHLNQVSRGRPVPLPDASSPMEEATVWTPWTLRTTLEAGALTWTWSSSTSTQSTGLSASSYSASFATSSSLLFDSLGEQWWNTTERKGKWWKHLSMIVK